MPFSGSVLAVFAVSLALLATSALVALSWTSVWVQFSHLVFHIVLWHFFWSVGRTAIGQLPAPRSNWVQRVSLALSFFALLSFSLVFTWALGGVLIHLYYGLT